MAGACVVGRAGRSLRSSSVDLRGCGADPIPLLQNIAAGHGLSVHPDEVVFRLPIGHVLGEELVHSGSLGDLDVVSKAAAVVI